jgi:hypothetical protein
LVTVSWILRRRKFPSLHGSSLRFPFYVDAQNWKRRAITTEVGPYRWHTHTLNVIDCVGIGDGEICSSLLFIGFRLNDIFKIISFGGLTDLPT